MVSITARAIRLWLKVDLRAGLLKMMMERKLPTRPSKQINGMAMNLIISFRQSRRGSSWYIQFVPSMVEVVRDC